MAEGPYAKSPIPCPIYPIINNEFNGNTYINSDTNKGGKVYINGEEAGAGGIIQELADGETLENRGVNLSMPVTFEPNGRIRSSERMYREDQPSGTAQCVAWAVMPTFDEPIRVKSARLMVYFPTGATPVELEYGICTYDDTDFSKEAIGTFTPRVGNSETITDYPKIAIDKEISDGTGIYIALPMDGSVTSTAICGKASDDYTNEFPAKAFKFDGDDYTSEAWGYSMACLVEVGNTTINRVTGVDIGNGEPMDMHSEVEDSETGKLYFDKENRKVYAGFDGEWEDISKYNADTLCGETNLDRGLTMGELSTHTITETEASPDSVRLYANPSAGEIGYLCFATPNGETHTVRSFTPQLTVNGASSVNFEYGIAYQYGGYWEFYEEGTCILPSCQAASPVYPQIVFSGGITLDDNTCLYLKPLVNSEVVYAHVSTNSGEVSEHMYLTVTKTAEGWRHTIVNKAIAGTYTHLDSVAYTENRLTGVDSGSGAPTNYEENTLTGKIYVDTTNNRAYLGIGTSWYPITLGTPISNQ